MAAASKYDHILSTVRGLIEADTSFTVHKTYGNDFAPIASASSDTAAYVWIDGDEYGTTMFEVGPSLEGMRTCIVGVYCMWALPEDTDGTGDGAQRHALVAEKVEYRLNPSTALLPYSDTTPTHRVSIHGFEPISTTGYIDDRRTSAAAMLKYRVYYTQERI